MRHDVHDRRDVPFLGRPAGAAAGQRQRRLQVLHECDVALVPGFHRGDVTEERAAEQGEVADQVEHLVARELVGEAQRLGVPDGVLADDDRALDPAALDPARAPQRLEIALEHERARGRDLLPERLVVDVERDALPPDQRVVVVDDEGDAVALVGHRRQRHAVLRPGHRPRHLDVALRAVLFDEPRLGEYLREGRGAAVRGLRHFHRRSLDDEVVDPEPRDRRQQMLHGVDLDAVLLEDRAPAGARIEPRVLGTDRDFGPVRQVDTHEAQPGARLRGLEGDAAVLAGVETDALDRDFTRDRALLAADHRTSSPWARADSFSSFSTRVSSTLVRSKRSGSFWR